MLVYNRINIKCKKLWIWTWIAVGEEVGGMGSTSYLGIVEILGIISSFVRLVGFGGMGRKER